MPWKGIEGGMIPEQTLRPVRHMLVPERSGANRVQHGAAKPAFELKLDQHRSAVTVTFEFLLAGFGQYRLPDDARG